MEAFMESLGEPRVDDGLEELLADPLVRSLQLSDEDVASLSAEPKIVTTITALFNLYKSTRNQLESVLEGIARRELDSETPPEASGDRSRGLAREEPREKSESTLRFELSPFDEVTEFLEKHENWFPVLEERAEKARRDLGLATRLTSQSLIDALGAHAGIDVRIVAPGEGNSSVVRRWEPQQRVLTVSSEMPELRMRFQLGHALGLSILEEEGLHDVISGNHAVRFRETRPLLKIHLANYLAGALLLPYDEFYREVRRTRYDVELLTAVFDSTYEAIAHRLCNLSDPLRRGLPFYFLRVDVAGNISKRYSATALRFVNLHGSCPKSAVHLAFLTPNLIRRRYEMYPDGSTYFVFAKVVAEPRQGSLGRGTVYSIGLGTYADNAKHLAYADDMPFADPRRMALPVGTSCRFCERTDCNQRAAPSYKFAFRVDEYTKKDNFFSPLVDGDREADVAKDAER
jgi:hypothetical protein